MGAAFLIKGLILGFSIAAPVGPIGVLCIRRTLSRGMLNGFLSEVIICGFGVLSPLSVL